MGSASDDSHIATNCRGGPIITSSSWPSMADQFDLANRVFGTDGRQRVLDWLDGQAGYIDNADFTRSFANRFAVLGVAVGEYSHRHVHSPSGDLLGGIRFYNRDARRPFVEVIAHSFASIDEVRDCVRKEWSSFRPGFVRLRTAPEVLITESNARLHKSIHIARYADLRLYDGLVTLEPFEQGEQAVALVDRRYKQLQSDDPDLAKILSPASPNELREWHDGGQLYAIRLHDETVGVLAIVPSSVGWIDGDEVSEEVIDTGKNGHGYAAAAQSAWAARIATDRNTLLIGTIHGSNVASRRTAEAVGRVRVLDDYDVAL
jgi:hypothetical protein